MLPAMAQPARRPEPVDEALELDPAAVQRAYQLHRARRRAHRNRQRETKRAKLRFWLVLIVLVAASIYLSIVIWHQIQRTFGL
jgi:type VI protein secretion system component VasF